MKKLISTIVAAGALAVSAQASATIFDFEQITDGADYGTISGTYADGSAVNGDVGEAAFQELVWTVDNITLTATGSTVAGDAWAYLDQGDAGLGVCSLGLKTDNKGPNQCDPGSDDNVTTGEILNISFDQLVNVNLAASTFRDANHNVHGDDHLLEVNKNDGAGWVYVTAANDVFETTAFSLRASSHPNDVHQFYVDALSVSVPEPGTLALMGLGLAGLGFVRRRKA